MKATLDIPSDELRDAMRFTKSKTKREAIIKAIARFNVGIGRRSWRNAQARSARSHRTMKSKRLTPLATGDSIPVVSRRRSDHR